MMDGSQHNKFLVTANLYNPTGFALDYKGEETHLLSIYAPESFVTTPPVPTPGGRRGITVEMSGALTKGLPQRCGVNTRGMLYIGNSRLWWKTAVVLPTSGPHSVWLLAEICWTNSQSTRYSSGVGGSFK